MSNILTEEIADYYKEVFKTLRRCFPPEEGDHWKVERDQTHHLRKDRYTLGKMGYIFEVSVETPITSARGYMCVVSLNAEINQHRGLMVEGIDVVTKISSRVRNSDHNHNLDVHEAIGLCFEEFEKKLKRVIQMSKGEFRNRLEEFL